MFVIPHYMIKELSRCSKYRSFTLILRQLNPVHISSNGISNPHFTIFFPSTPCSVISFSFETYFLGGFILDLSYARYTFVKHEIDWGIVQPAGRWRVPFPKGSWDFSLTLFFRPHYGPRAIDPACKRNACQEYLLGGKCGRCLGMANLQSSFAECLEILAASTSYSPQGLCKPV